MSKKVIHGNTKQGKAEGYSFELKKRTTDNTKMYHMALYRHKVVKTGDRTIHTEDKQIRLYTPTDYDLLFVPKVIKRGDIVVRDVGNTMWHKNLSKKDGGEGVEMLFNPTLSFESEGEDSPIIEKPKEFEFTSKSQVSQAKNDVLLDYCQGHFQLHEFEGLSGAKMKELIIEKLNF